MTELAREDQQRQVRHARGGAADADADSPEAILDLARQLADRLARLQHHDGDDDAVRLARAMALNVVDLLEGMRRR
ncbi:Hypothetical protein A7982_02899 [Minicystis rosea]|nr:Hypothetical protein A7982_02899 [Minicystis rosea]